MTENNYPNGDLLWSPRQLQEKLGDEQLAIIDLRPAHELMEGVIPGAAHFDPYGITLTRTSPDIWEEYYNLLRSSLALRGAGHKMTVVLYETTTGTRVGRAFWFLEYLGHQDVHVLNGGFEAWKAAGYEITRTMTAPKPQSLKPLLREDIFINADQLREALGRVYLLDTRTDKEWTGENTRGGPRGGIIPGAAHLEWTQYIDDKGRMKSAEELTTLFEGAGIRRDKPVVPY